MKCELCGKEIGESSIRYYNDHNTEVLWYHKSCYDKSMFTKEELETIIQYQRFFVNRNMDRKIDSQLYKKITGLLEVAPQTEPEVAPQEGNNGEWVLIGFDKDTGEPKWIKADKPTEPEEEKAQRISDISCNDCGISIGEGGVAVGKKFYCWACYNGCEPEESEVEELKYLTNQEINIMSEVPKSAVVELGLRYNDLVEFCNRLAKEIKLRKEKSDTRRTE